MRKKEFIKKLYAIFLNSIKSVFGISYAKEVDAKLRFGRTLNLKNPKTLADKVSYIEINDQSEIRTKCTDKYEVRNYVRERGLERLLIPIVGGPWSNVNQVQFEELPDSFILKATHGCKMNYIVKDKREMDVDSCRKKMYRWLKTTYGEYSIEPHYKSIPHRIYAEEYLGDSSELYDYKIHCINGIPEFILVCGNREKKMFLDLYDVDWNHIPEIVSDKKCCSGNGNIERPSKLDEMLKVSEILSKEFQFVRVDLYIWKEHIYFGELTFSPSCCVFPHFSERFITKMGEKLII